MSGVETGSAISTKTLVAASLGTTSAAGGGSAAWFVSNIKNEVEIVQPKLNKDRFLVDRIKKESKSKKNEVYESKDCKYDYFIGATFEKPKDYIEPVTSYKAFNNKEDLLGVGCVQVSWKKKTTTESEPNNGWWKGEINWEWLLRIGDEGLLFIGEGRNAASANGKIDVKYKLIGLKYEEIITKVSEEKNTREEKWVVKYYKEGEVKDILGGDDEKKFPRGFKDEEINGYTGQTEKRSWAFAPWYDKSCKWNVKESYCNFDLDDTSETSEGRWDWTEISENYDYGDDEDAEDELEPFSDLHDNFDKIWELYKDKVDLEDEYDRAGIWQ